MKSSRTFPHRSPWGERPGSCRGVSGGRGVTETNDARYRSSLMTFYNKKWVLKYTINSTVIDYKLAVVKRLLWQLGWALVDVAVMKRWSLK